MAVKKEKWLASREINLKNKLKFHAKIKAPKQRKKRDAQAKYIYELIVRQWLDLYEQGLYHPKMDIPVAQMETIVHNIGRLMADNITTANKLLKPLPKKK